MTTTAQLIARLGTEKTYKPEFLADLQAILNSLNAGANTLASVYGELAIAYNNNTAGFTDVLTSNITTGGGDLLITANVQGLIIDGTPTVNNGVRLKLLVDGAQAQLCTFNNTLQPAGDATDVFNLSFLKKISLVAGAHVIKIQGALSLVTDSPNLRIDPTTNLDHCTVFARELP